MADTIVSSGATSIGIVLNSGDTMEVLSGGTASATTINDSGLETVFPAGSTPRRRSTAAANRTSSAAPPMLW